MNRLFNDSWKFLKTSTEEKIDIADLDILSFTEVSIPHDWLICDTKNLYENSIGYYCKTFDRPDISMGGHCFLRFEGVYMDSEIFLNGEKIFEWKYGYTTFTFEITDYLVEKDNVIVVKVNYISPNSRWYSGAGIFRNVWIITKPAEYLVIDGTYVSSEAIYNDKKTENFLLKANSQIIGAKEGGYCRYSLFENDNYEKAVFVTEVPIPYIGAEDSKKLTTEVEQIINKPQIWSPESPYIYKFKVELIHCNEIVDEDSFVIGFRDFKATPDGLFLNGKHIKLQGTCEHNDLGLFGSAINREAIERRLKILKRFGVNAIRTGHTPPAVELLELCDELGIMVQDESFDMWLRPKTTYDYARFFNEWMEKDVKSWITRDRNHPSVVMWSIGNEISDTHVSEQGKETMQRLIDEVKKYDPHGNAVVTLASNYIAWENTQKCADVIKCIGYNYTERLYEQHHKEHPDWIIYGSETSSIVSSRGTYHFPASQSILSEIDEQCSSLGNSTTSWGAKSPEQCLNSERENAFSLGQFVWSGFDYIGEPTPYHTKNSYFGMFDTAGFPKDLAYMYASDWTHESIPFVHLLPYWDWNEGQLIDVRIASNCYEVELKVEGKSLGRRQLIQEDGKIKFPTWQIPYKEGSISAIAYDRSGEAVAFDIKTSFGDSVAPDIYVEECKIQKSDLMKDKKGNLLNNPENYVRKAVIYADDRRIYFVHIDMLDIEGIRVENAMDYVEVNVSDNARVVGMDNGDSTDYDSYRSNVRKLFNGKLLAVIERISEGNIEISVKRRTDRIPARKIEISRVDGSYGKTLINENPSAKYKAIIRPYGAEGEIHWAVVNAAGIEIKTATLQQDGDFVTVTGKGDGDFYLRAYSTVDDKIKILSQIELSAQGFGCAFSDAYDFYPAGLYEKTIGDVGTGNEKGIATSRNERSGVFYKDIDFGEFGSDEITMWIFALTSEEYPVEIYDGDYENGAELLATVVYQKPSKWNVYQEETFKLPKRLKGIHGLSFILNCQKIHLKGFTFLYKEKAYERINASEFDSISGDNYVIDKNSVNKIGNNVTLRFDNMNFGEKGATTITIKGRTPLDKNPIHIHFTKDGKMETEIVEFLYNSEEQKFDITRLTGNGTIEFIFMPGSNFDFEYFLFQ